MHSPNKTDTVQIVEKRKKRTKNKEKQLKVGISITVKKH